MYLLQKNVVLRKKRNCLPTYQFSNCGLRNSKQTILQGWPDMLLILITKGTNDVFCITYFKGFVY